MSKAIVVEDLSKAYQLGDFGTGTITRDVERFFARVRGKEDPYLRIGETNDRSAKGESDIAWCLKNLNFEIEQGDAVGIIGRNGAGKSTLLKILSRITSPTTGSIKIKGRIASLLEVGTGFHPELTGRENIYLNGAILGMRKAEIKRRFDEIVDFAGVERYIDTPVKRYSSGMYVRLAFAVAAHLESEILIVDEVLAVGDAEFQKKCLGKMGDISHGQGRTVLFVSHNMGAIKTLCNNAILLNNGKLVQTGTTNKIIDLYSNKVASNDPSEKITDLKLSVHPSISINQFTINGSESSIVNLDPSSNSKSLNITIKGICKLSIQFNIELRFFTKDGILIALYSPAHLEGKMIRLDTGVFLFEDNINVSMLANGEYFLNINLSSPNVETYFTVEDILLVKNDLQTLSGRSLSNNEVGYFVIE